MESNKLNGVVKVRESFDTPILLIAFNNASVTEKTFKIIREVKPTALFIAIDGPRKDVSGESLKVAETRAIAQSIDWPCKINLLFPEENSGGAGVGVYKALDWFFSSVEEGIVLEYDCIPHEEFFKYCEDLLNRYRDEPSVKIITGANLQDGNVRGEGSYYFSAIPYTWGWASWRRTWKEYIFDLSTIETSYFNRSIPFQDIDRGVVRYWRWVNYLMTKKRIDTWDYQLMFSIWRNGGKCINPNNNLVTHYVDGKGGTYFTQHVPGTTNIPGCSIYPMQHPFNKDMDVDAYVYHCKKYGLSKNWSQLLFAHLVIITPRKVKKIIKLLIGRK